MGIRKPTNTDADFLPGTLEMLILKTVSREPNHGWGIAQHIQQVSQDTLKIGEGSLYPALQRLLLNDYVKAEWGVTENNRRARYYKITPLGRRQLETEKQSFEFLLAGIARVMEAS
jgi:transcriptional regulator